jgi:hypothetical protein
MAETNTATSLVLVRNLQAKGNITVIIVFLWSFPQGFYLMGYDDGWYRHKPQTGRGTEYPEMHAYLFIAETPERQNKIRG